ncbi:cysteine hydrolase family protein [Sphingomonas jeddahensis]|uniref:Streptothricin hydrolase n=1 Tax=Sphingomonas jeddahensis TaxID=1915074 RepID=A0A1V2EWT6_9SPHN|nr:cysteine hydrolase family protein [Sphingomonas jeddahensis]ONF97136.1 Streptothricin hydrolase [Sphingomonas jeddahensis]
MSKRAIVVVDLQNDYWPSGKFPLVGIDAAAANAAKVVEAARASGDEVIHVRHEFTDPAMPFFNPGTEGSEIHPVVQPVGEETVILKNYPNSFKDTGLKQHLEEQGIEEVVIVGAMSHMCIAATGRAASDYGYKTVVVHDACATRDVEFGGVTVPAAEVHAANMSALAFAYAQVVGTDEYTAR